MSTEREQVIPDDSFRLERPTIPESKGLKDADPELYSALQVTLGALRQDMVPGELQEELFRGMNPSVQRSMVSEASGMEAGVLATFKSQLNMIDAILRRTFKEDGTLMSGQEDLGIEPKDVLNLSLKVTQMMVRELPKVYSMDRVQKMEAALLKVMSEHLSREQQEAFLKALDDRKEEL